MGDCIRPSKLRGLVEDRIDVGSGETGTAMATVNSLRLGYGWDRSIDSCVDGCGVNGRA